MVRIAGEVCTHCGTPGAWLEHDGLRFCCNGCAQVHAILRQQNLLGFYQIPENEIRSLRDKPQTNYSYTDSEWFRKIFVQASAGRWSIRLKLPDIHCAACVWLLEKLPQMLDGVLAARINYLRKELTVTAKNTLPVSQVVQLVADLGYPPDFSERPTQALRLSTHDKRLLARMAVAAFAFGNAMLFSLPEYFNPALEKKFSLTFIALNSALALLVLFYSAGEFFRNAWRALRHKKITIDLPIALGIAAMFARSAWDLATSKSPGYFDTFNGLIFFLLIGRYVQSRSYAWLNFERDNLLFLPLAVRVKTEQGERMTAIGELKTGDRLRLLHGEIAPTRCRVLSGAGAVDYSFITGESVPVAVQAGDVLLAGGRIFGNSLLVEVQEAIQPAVLNRIWENSGGEVELPQISFAERVIPWFTATVAAIAFAALFYWLPHDGSLAWDAFTAVLVITCPCALAMARPFSFFTTQSTLARAGLFLKSAVVVERFFGLKTIAFDKTGTLTSAGNYQVEFFPADSGSATHLPVLAALARESVHPLSQAIARFLENQKPEKVIGFRELPGYGTSAEANGCRYLLGSRAFLERQGVAVAASAGEGSEVHAACGTSYLGYFRLQNALRPGLEKILQKLAQRYQLALLSGDSERERNRFAAFFPDAQKLYFNLSPEEKAAAIGRLKQEGPVLMLGDGLNDAPALKAADLGIALSEKQGHFSPASDAILNADALPLLPQLLRQAEQARKTTIAAYLLSFAYNTVGVVVAVSGKLTPLFCAVLMPISSLSVIGLAFASAWLGAYFRRLRRNS